jgi:hypothetical protein
MPIFISYSHKDKAFADKLARNLVWRRHHIWMDRWELNVGDSLIDKIQTALTGSSAILAILSKNSVESGWVKKEINAGLIRELEERQSLLMPCVIDDCEIPLFLKEKRYADFRSDPDRALNDLDRALAGISNPYQGRTETPKFDVDWSVDWGAFDDDTRVVEFTFVDHGPQLPYVAMSQFRIMCNPVASRRFAAAEKKGERNLCIRDILDLVIKSFTKEELTMVLDGPLVKSIAKEIVGGGRQKYLVRVSCRRMGTDNGMDTIVYLDNNLHRALKHMDETTYRPSPSRP